MTKKAARNDETLRSRLRQEFDGRCAYCGIRLGVSEGSIDHFYPRRLYPELENDPLNLLLACTACNTRKSDRFPTDPEGRPLLLHPRFSSYEDHIRFDTDGRAIPLTSSGRITVDTFDLNRPRLVIERKSLDKALRNPMMLAVAELADAHSAPTLASALFACLDIDGRTSDADVVARLLTTSGIAPARPSGRLIEQPRGRSRADRYWAGRHSYHIIEADADDVTPEDYSAAMLSSALILRLRKDGYGEAATGVARRFEPERFRVGDVTEPQNLKQIKNSPAVSQGSTPTSAQPVVEKAKSTDSPPTAESTATAVSVPTTTALAMDPLHRLKLAQQQLKHHPGKTCPKCGEPTLSFIDVHDDSRDRVTRTWTCSKDRYTSSAVGIPIAEWASNMRSAWEAKAALLRANKQIIRCPDCGNESIEAEESGVDRIGTSQHIRLSCKTPGCTFQKRETPRSIWGTVKASIRSVALLAIVGAGLFGTAYVLRTTTNPPAMSPQPSSTSVSSTQAPALSSTFSAPPSAQPPASGSAIAAPAQAADCTKASLPAFVLGAAQIDAGEFEEIDSAKFELTRITNLLSAEEKPQLWVNAAKVLERSSTGAPTRWVVALVNVRPSNEPAFCAWLKCQGWSSCQLARRQP